MVAYAIAFFVILAIAIFVSIYARSSRPSGGIAPAPTGPVPVARITVQPLYVCNADEIIRVTWEATGDRTRLGTNPPVVVVAGTLGPVPNRSTTPVQVHLDPTERAGGFTRFRIESATSGPVAEDYKDVTLISTSRPQIIGGGSATCGNWQGLGNAWF